MFRSYFAIRGKLLHAKITFKEIHISSKVKYELKKKSQCTVFDSSAYKVKNYRQVVKY